MQVLHEYARAIEADAVDEEVDRVAAAVADRVGLAVHGADVEGVSQNLGAVDVRGREVGRALGHFGVELCDLALVDARGHTHLVRVEGHGLDLDGHTVGLARALGVRRGVRLIWVRLASGRPPDLRKIGRRVGLGGRGTGGCSGAAGARRGR
jgi:hypothetical protein